MYDQFRMETMDLAAAMPLFAIKIRWITRLPPWRLTKSSSGPFATPAGDAPTLSSGATANIAKGLYPFLAGGLASAALNPPTKAIAEKK
jgi:hypothetical protein